METNVYTAFIILMVGMITVFTILFIVVVTGKGVIWFINRIERSEIAPVTSIKNKSGNPASQTVAVIAGVVESITAGRGTIDKIEKLE